MRNHCTLLLFFVFLIFGEVGEKGLLGLKTFYGQTSGSQVLIDNIHKLAVTPNGKELWAFGMDSHALVIANIESENYQIVGKIDLPGYHSAPISNVIFSPDGRYAYVPNSLQCVYEKSCANFSDFNQVVVIDTEIKEIISIIPMQEPYSPTASLAITPDGKYLYLTVADFNGQKEGIYKLDLKSQKMDRFLEVPGVNYITISQDGRYLYCTRGWQLYHSPLNLFSVIDADRFMITSSITVGTKPQYIAITPDGKKAYVSNQFSNNVSVIDISNMEVKTTIAVGSFPEGIAITPDGRKAYVANSGVFTGLSTYEPGNTVSVIDTKNDLFIKNIQVGIEPRSVVMNAYGTKAYVSDGNANGLQPAEAHIINTINDVYQGSIIFREPAFYTPTGIDITPDGGKIFVISEATERLMIVDAQEHRVIANMNIAPRAVKVSRNGQYLYVYSPQYSPNGEGKFFIINTSTLKILKAIELGVIRTSPIGDQRTLRIVLDSDEDTAYLAGGNGDEVIVLDLNTNQIAARIRIGAEGDNRIVPARGIAITPDDSKLFVSNCLSQSISVIDTKLKKVIDTIQVASLPSEIEISSDGKRVYVLQQHTTDIMTIIDAETHKTIRVVDFPASINGANDFFLSPDERYVYIACFDPNWIMVYDLKEQDRNKGVTKIIRTGLDPFNMAVTSDKRLLYITNFTSDNIVIVDTQTNQIVDTILLNDLEYRDHVLYVSAKGSDVTGIGSKLNPFAKIQNAISWAISGDTLCVAQGTYDENLFIDGKDLHINGGYEETNWVRDLSNYETIIDGGKRAPSVQLRNSSTVIDGFTIQNGQSGHAGGIESNGGAPEIRYCTIKNNRATEAGGGGGLHFGDGAPKILNCNVIENHASGSGGISGGIRAGHCDISIKNTLIARNTGETGIHFNDVTGSIINCTVAGNPTGGFGFNNSPVTVLNSIEWHNNMGNWGTLDNIHYSNIEGGASGTGNMNQNPLFADETAGNYQLQEGSPCINAGSPDTTGSNLPEFDVAGNPRISSSRIDMGAYEYQFVTDVAQPTVLPQSYALYQNYPNPFNSETLINYQLPNVSKVTLSIYNLKGQKIRTLVDAKKETGFYKITWDGKDNAGRIVATGVYFYRMKAGEFTDVKKLMLLR